MDGFYMVFMRGGVIYSKYNKMVTACLNYFLVGDSVCVFDLMLFIGIMTFLMPWAYAFLYDYIL